MRNENSSINRRDISIIHLSDIHFKKEKNSILEKEVKLFDSIKNECSNCKYIFIVITGDIAFSGLKEEFDIAKKFFMNLERKIKNYINELIPVQFIFTPGNHDCDFTSNQEVRDILIDKVNNDPQSITPTIIDTCTHIQKNYFDFIQCFDSTNYLDIDLSNKLFKRYIFIIEEEKVVFNSYNFSWISKRNEKQAQLVFPVSNIDRELLIDDESTLTISLCHHPFHWLQHENIRELKEIINRSSDILLTGHEHTSSGLIVNSMENNYRIQHIEASALQEGNGKRSSFNTFIIDLNTLKQEFNEFKWKNDYYEKILKNDKLKLTKKKKTIFSFKENYLKQLHRLGIKVNHPTKEDIKLSDIYIYPDLKVLNTDDESDNSSFIEISSQDLMEKDDIKKTIIYGSDTSGKTSLLQMYQLYYQRKNFVPILLDSRDFDIENYRPDIIKKLIIKTYKKQYIKDSKTLAMFEQLDKSNVILLIDNFEKIELNSEYKSILLNNLLSVGYENIIITANENIKLEATTEGELAKSLKSWNHYLILEMGHKLRNEFIKKWINLGQEHIIESKDLLYQTRQKAESINKTIGHNFVPAYPIYIMTLLQAMTSNDSNDLSKSSYGHYYHYLIMDNLKNSSDKMDPNNLNTIFGFTSTLAFNIFDEKKYLFTDEYIQDFYIRYCKQKEFTPTFNIIETLINSNILVQIDDKFKFTHNFIYYYFVAEYFRDNFDKTSIQDIIYKMIKRLYRTEFANILMFIIHLSPKESIINKIIEESKLVLNTFTEFKFSTTEVKKLNTSIKNELIESNGNSLEENHKEKLDVKDQRANHEKRLNKIDRDDADYDEDIKELNLFANVNLAFKMIEIQGEIIKNYSGTLDGVIKTDLINGTQSIGLRTLKSLVDLFETEHDLIVKEIKKIIEKKKHISLDKKNEDVSAFIFSLASNISMGVIKRIAKATASKDLSGLNKRIIDEDRSNASKLLIEQARELDFENGLDIKNIIDLYQKFLHNKNNFSISVLRKLVLEHLYMFEVTFDKRQSICKKLEINDKQSRSKLISSKK